MPVENRRGPSLAPARISSAFVNTVSLSFDGSCDVVTPNARFAISGQLACAEQAARLAADVRVHVDDAGHDRLALDVDAPRAGRHLHRRGGPTAVIRLPSTTTVPFSITPGVPGIAPGLRPAIVMMRAPTSAIEPAGTSLLAVKPMAMPFASGRPAFGCAARRRTRT